MDKVIELTFTIDLLAKNVEDLEIQNNKNFELSNLLRLTAQAIRSQAEKLNNP